MFKVKWPPHRNDKVANYLTEVMVGDYTAAILLITNDPPTLALKVDWKGMLLLIAADPATCAVAAVYLVEGMLNTYLLFVDTPEPPSATTIRTADSVPFTNFWYKVTSSNKVSMVPVTVKISSLME